MKRFHVHVSMADLPESIRFYRELFGAEPSVLRSDYAKWMVEEPRVNFAISQREVAPGIQHLGSCIDDPQGVRWETFLTTGESTVYGAGPTWTARTDAHESPCCGPSCCTDRAA
jgi:hypothetical protein